MENLLDPREVSVLVATSIALNNIALVYALGLHEVVTELKMKILRSFKRFHVYEFEKGKF